MLPVYCRSITILSHIVTFLLTLIHMHFKLDMIYFVSFKLRLAVTKEQVTNHLQNDFNTSNALLSLTDFIDEINKSLAHNNISDSVIPGNITSITSILSCYMYVKTILEIFGIIITTKKVIF